MTWGWTRHDPTAICRGGARGLILDPYLEDATLGDLREEWRERLSRRSGSHQTVVLTTVLEDGALLLWACSRNVVGRMKHDDLSARSQI
jgi:hypothetical protein